MVKSLSYTINNQAELNLSYMPFIKECGLFIPSSEGFTLGENIIISITLPNQTAPRVVDAEVVWITPKNALYQIYQGIGVQFKGENAKAINEQIKSSLDDTIDVGGYSYGLTSEPVV